MKGFTMNFYSKEFLEQHIKSILDFYEPVIIDEKGGYYQNFYDNGERFNEDFKQLVSSTRIIVNYALAGQLFADQDYRERAKHGLQFLETQHWLEDEQKYVWTFRHGKPDDLTQQAYGYAFVLLAYSALKKVTVIQDKGPLDFIFGLLEEKFWQPKYGLYADEISAEGVLNDYRGQNSNMHMCEAMIAAFEATGDHKFLMRAKTLANNIAQRQAALSDGLIWEHFDTEFKLDWEYNKDDPKNLYRPWGFQPGHQTEWAKLLLQIYRLSPEPWMLKKARELFDRAWDAAWDEQYGGLIYGFDTQGNWCDDDKYFWVQAESFAAAAMLYAATGEEKYRQHYDQLWDYCWQHFVDHEYGAWFRILRRDNSKYSNEKSSAGAKCDYHTIGACLEVLRVKDTSGK